MSSDSNSANSLSDSIFFPKINGNFKNKDIVSLKQFDKVSLRKLFKYTAKLKKLGGKRESLELLKGNIITLLFYEPSSRTFGSFVSAIKRLGGQTLEIQNPQQFSSVSKGETFEDTIRVFESYSDAIVIRHPEVGTAIKAAEAAFFVPIINAGDGVGEHPTQALLDMYTIFEHARTLSHLTGLIAGDIKNGRTVHSLLRGLSLYEGNTIYLLSEKQLRLDRKELEQLRESGLNVIEIEKIKEIPKNCDFWYWTRVQKERFASEIEYKAVNNKYIVDQKLLDTYGNKNMILMHPLPRVGGIVIEVDRDLRAVYLTKQIKNGLYVRMALLSLILGKIP